MQASPVGFLTELDEFVAFQRIECISAFNVREKWPHYKCSELNVLSKHKYMRRCDYKLFVPWKNKKARQLHQSHTFIQILSELQTRKEVKLNKINRKCEKILIIQSKK